MSSDSVQAVVVTHNRKELLLQCLDAIARQAHPVAGVLVVDNASTDGTEEALAKSGLGARLRLDYLRLERNGGGAEGFHYGVRHSLASGADWIWLMDDDTIARPTALAELLKASEAVNGSARPQLLYSRVEWSDGNVHPMNRPHVLRRNPELLVASVGRGLLPLRAATFVSLLLSRDAVDRVGLPARHFFFQADDIEYTARVLRDGHGFFVPSSVVEHRTQTKHTAVDDHRRFYYHARNTVLMLRGSAWRAREKPVLLFWLVTSTLAYLRQNRFRPGSVKHAVQAIAAGLRFPRREG